MSPRISTAQLYDRTRDSVAESREKEAKTAQKAASLKAITRPSEDPQGWAVAKQFKDELAVRETSVRNGNLAKQMLGATEQILKQSTEYVERAYELALGAVGKDRVVQEAAHSEVKALYESLLQSLNTRYGDRTLLAGFRSSSPAFDVEGTFLGDSGKIQIELEQGRKVAVNISGEEAILGHSGQGVNILELFQRLERSLSDQDDELTRTTFMDFQKAVSQLTAHRTDVGSRMNRIDRMLSEAELEKISHLEVVAKIEEADPIQVFTDLAKDQTALKASLETGRKLLTEVPPDTLLK